MTVTSSEYGTLLNSSEYFHSHRDKQWTLVNIAINHNVSLNAGNFLAA